MSKSFIAATALALTFQLKETVSKAAYLLYISIVMLVTTATFSNAACLVNQDLSEGIVFEYTAPKGMLYDVLIGAGEGYVLWTGYTSIRPEEEKLLTKSYLGLFTVSSWREKSPQNPTLHSFEPRPEELPTLANGVEFTYQETWEDPGLGVFSAGRTLRVIDEKSVSINDCSYDVLEVEVVSMVELPNGTQSPQFATFLYVPELLRKDGIFGMYDAEKMNIRYSDSEDFVPVLK